MSDMNYDGTICADKTYTEGQLRHILNLSQDQLGHYYKMGLPYFQASRSQRSARLISGAAFHRFVERMSVPCPDDADAVA